ncbi:putative Ig domain-containing protein [Pirellulaceae bacterium SH449]
MRILKKRRSLNKNRARTRSILLEQLEDRRVLYSPWQNPARPLDVDNDQTLSPLDALVLINRINAFGSGPLPIRINPLDYYYDVDGDSQLTPLDVLRVINAINSGASGSFVFPNPGDSEVAPAGFISVPLAHLPGSQNQIVNIEAQLTVRKREFNEMGIFVVDDQQGRVNGLLPDHPEYPQAVWRSASRRVLYSRSDVFDLTTQLSLPAASHVRVYVLQSATSNGSPESHLRVLSLAENRLRIGWEQHAPVSNLPIIGDRGFDDAIVDLTLSPPVTSNAAPFISFIPNQAHPEETLFVLQVIAGDPNLANDTLTFSLDAAPPSLSINPNTGLLSWTPTEVDGPGTYGVTVRVTDSASAFAIRSFTISVHEVNRPPILSPISNTTLTPGQTLTLQTSASDPDIPTNRLTYSLRPGAPAGASIDPTTGLFRWTAPSVLSETTFPITVRVTDDGSPSLFDEKSFTITVLSDWLEIVEGDRFVTEHRFPITLAAGISHLETTFSRLNFDRTDRRRMRDAFEVALLDSAGRPVVGSIAPDRDALFNQTDSQTTLVASGTHYEITDIGPADIGGRLTIDVSHLPDGFTGDLVLRLVNNDSDNSTRVSFLPHVTQIPGSKRVAASFSTDRPFPGTLDGSVRAFQSDDWRHLSQITPSIAIQYDWTAYDTDTQTVIAGLTLTNQSQQAIRGPVLITVDQIESLTASLTGYAGILPWDTSRFIDPAVAALAGSPFFDATPALAPGNIFANAVETAWEPGQSIRFPLEFHQSTLERFDYRIQVLGTINRPPRFTSIPVTTVALGNAYVYNSQAIDPDLDVLQYALISGPSGLAVDAATGQVTWTPTASQQGSHLVTLRTTDPWGAYDTQIYTISVSSSGLNRPPVFVTMSVVDAYVGSPYTYASRANDPDLDRLTYSILAGPDGMRMERGPAHSGDPGNPAGNVSWTPAPQHIGQFVPVSLQVDDGRGGVAIQSYEIYVHPNPNNRPPVIVTTPQFEFDIAGLLGQASGIVTPSMIELDLAPGELANIPVTVQIPRTLPKVDVFLLLDDTGSFASQGPILANVFPQVITQLQTSLPDVDFGFGVGRFEDYGHPWQFTSTLDRPFILNQPILPVDWPDMNEWIVSALNRTAPGSGGDGPESLIEALFQVATGVGFDGNNNGNLLESGPVGAVRTQTTPGNSGDVPPFISINFSQQRPQAVELPLNVTLDVPANTLANRAYRFNLTEGEFFQIETSTNGGMGQWFLLNPQDRLVRTFEPGASIIDMSSLDGEYLLVANNLSEPGTVRRTTFAPISQPLSFDVETTLDANPSDVWREYTFTLASPSFVSFDAISASESVIWELTDSSGYVFSDFINTRVPISGSGHGFDGSTLHPRDQQHILAADSYTLTIRGRNPTNPIRFIPSIFPIQSSSTAAIGNPSSFSVQANQMHWVRIDGTPGERFRLVPAPEITLDAHGLIVFQYPSSSSNPGSNSDPIHQFGLQPTFWAGYSSQQDISLMITPNGVGSTVSYPTPISIDFDIPIFGTVSTEHPREDFEIQLDDWSYVTVTRTSGSTDWSFIAQGGSNWFESIEGYDPNNQRPFLSRPILLSPGAHRITVSPGGFGSSTGSQPFGFTVARQPLQNTYTQAISSGNNGNQNDEFVPFGPGTRGGAGFRPGAIPIILAATDTGTAYQADGATSIVGINGLEIPLSELSSFSRDNTPGGRGATIQQAIDALLLQGALVVGLGTNASISAAPRQTLEAISRLTGAINSSDQPLANNIPNSSILPGEPLYFQITDDPNSLSAGVVAAIESAVRNAPTNVDLLATDFTNGFTNLTGIQFGVRPGSIVPFETEFLGDGQAYVFDLQFVRPGAGETVGSIPVAINDRYAYNSAAIDPDDDPVTLELIGETHGASFDPDTGKLRWRPSAPGHYEFTLQASDPWGATDTQTWTVTVGDVRAENNPPILAPFPPMVVPAGQPIEITARAFDLDSGDQLRFGIIGPAAGGTAIPRGLQIDPLSGKISWTPTINQIGLHAVTIRVTDAKGGSDQQIWLVEISPPTVTPNRQPNILSTPIDFAVVDRPYRYQILAEDLDLDPLSYSAIVAPYGLVVDPETGVVAWNPTSADLGEHDILLRVSDGRGGLAFQSYRLFVSQTNDPPTITSHPSGPAVPGLLWTYPVTATDPNGDAITFGLLPNQSPTGATIDPQSGLLAWTPLANGAYRFVVSANDGRGGVAYQEFLLPVSDAAPPRIVSTPTSPARVGQPYEYLVIATDPNPDDTISLTLDEIALARGLTLVSQSCPAGTSECTAAALLQWTPNRTEPVNIAITATDSTGGTFTQSFTLQILPTGQPNRPPEITSTPLGPAVRNLAYRYPVIATDPDGDPLTYSLDADSLTRGASIDATGLLSWTPTSAGQFPFIVTVSDPLGASISQSFSLPVLANAPPRITSTPPTRLELGQSLSYNITAVDPNPSDTIRFSAVPRDGLSIDPTSGLLAWTPTTPGSFTLTVFATDNLGARDQQTFDLLVIDTGNNQPPQITGAPRNRLQLGSEYLWQVPATDPDADPLTFTLVSGPKGLTVTNEGILRWTPSSEQVTTGGEPHSVTVSVSDGRGGSNSASWRINVAHSAANTAPSITSVQVRGTDYSLESNNPPPAALLHAAAGRPYQALFDAFDPDGDTLVWSLVDAPSGVRIDSRGLVDYRPTFSNVGSQTITVQVTDTAGASDRFTYTLLTRSGNSPALIAGDPPVHHRRGTTYETKFTAVDADGDEIFFRFVPDYPNHAATLDETTGVLSWTPETEGTYRFHVAAVDPLGAGTQIVFDVRVDAFGPNDPPAFENTPPGVAEIGSTYSRRFPATDPEGDPITYTVVSGPAGLTINATDGIVTWNPPASLVNTSHAVRLTASDPAGNAAHYQFNLPVRTANRPPQYDSIPPTTITAGAVYRYDVLVSDPDFDSLTLALVAAPNGLVFDPQTRRVTWTTSAANIGQHSISVSLTDSRVPTPIEQSWILTVQPDISAPSVQIIVPQTSVNVGTELSIEVRASDDVGIAERTLRVNDTNLPISSAGFSKFTFQTPGRYVVTAAASDWAGNTTTTTLDVFVRDPNNAAPVIHFTQPTGGTSITAPTHVHLTVTDPENDLTSVQLFFAPADGSAPFRPFGSRVASAGSTLSSVTDLSLGLFDPTNLPNGSYILRAIARDAGFNETIRDTYVQVEGRLKLGNFSLSFNDLTIPVAGIPITIVRKYDTLDAQTSGDFGYGWSLDIRQATVRIDASTLGGVGSGRFRAFVDGTRVFVTTPEGTEEGFTFHAIPDQSVFGIPLSWKSFFIPDAGNSYRLEAPAGGLKKLGNEYLSGFGTTYNPQDPEFGNAFQVTTFPSRIKYNVNATTGKTVSLEDRYGNRVEPHYDGLHSNRGRSILFERDMRGRITRITDPAGHSLLYEYNAAGQLVSFYDRRATARLNDADPSNDPTPIRFAYNLAENPAFAGIPGAAHYLTQITDPLGVVAVQANFDPDTGRLIELVDAEGQSAQIAYDIVELTVASTSASGSTEVSLDRHGNPTRSVDEQGIVILTEYSDQKRGLPSRMTTIVGEPDTPEQIAAGTGDDQVVKFTFNQWGQRTSETDSRGHVTRTIYDNQGYPRQNIDVFGNATTFAFHDDQLVGTTDHLGNSTTFGYDSFGNITHVTQSNWSVGTSTTSSMVYNTFGDIIAMTDADGNSRSMQYDSVGRQIGASYVWTDPNGILPDKTLSSTTVLGPDGQLDVSIDPRGQTSRVLYDALNRGSTQIDSTGLNSETIYDRRGLAIEYRQESIDENGNSVWFLSRTLYDAAGRAIYSTDSFTEDVFTNHPEEITGTHTVYNTLGQVERTEQLVGLNIDIVTSGIQPPTSRLISAGTVISFSGAHYDDAGRVIETFNEHGLRSQTLYGQHGEVVESRTELPPASGASTGHWLVSRTIYDNFGRAIISTDGFLVPLDTPLGEDPKSLIAPPISMRITRTVYDSQGRSIATERYTDALVTLPPGGSAQPGRAAFVLQSPGTLESVSETLYDRAGRVWRTISGRVPLSTLSPTALAQSAALANYPTHGTARDPYAKSWNLSPGVLSDTLFDTRGRQIASLGHPLPASDVGLDLTLSPFNLPSSNFLVRLRNEKVYDSLGGATVTHTGIIHIEKLDGSFVKIDRSQERTRKDITDSFGQVIETIDAVGTPLESSTKREYDDRGRVVAEIDAIGTRKEFLYNDLDQLIAVKLPAVPNPLKADNPVEQPIYRYHYNVFGQMSKLVDANGRETQFAFDSRGQNTHRVLPDSQTESFSYDNRQRLVLHVSFEGVHKQSLYDDTPSGAGRMIGYNLFSSEQDYVNYQLNGTLPTGKLWETIRMSYDSRGRLESTIHQYRDGATVKLTDTWTNSYDLQNRLAQEASPTGLVQYQYDSLNRRIQVSAFTRDADGNLEVTPTSVVKYAYDILGRLRTVSTTVRDGVPVDVDPIVPGDQPERATYFYDLFGRMDYTEMPNGIVEDYKFDLLGRLDVMRHFQADNDNRNLTDNALLAIYDYEYRADGRRVGLTEKYGGSGFGFQPVSAITDAVLANSYTWTYDNAGRLIREILDSSDDSIDQTESYIMDLVGNRMRRTIDRIGIENDFTDVYVYDSSDRLLNEYRYNNLTSTGTPSQLTSYGWTGTQQTSKTVSVPSVSTMVQTMSYGLKGQLERVVTTTSDGSDTFTGRTQVEYRYDPRGIRFIATDYSYDLQTSSFELQGSTEYLIDHHNFTGYAQTVLETSKNAEGQTTKRISYTFGHDEITQTVSEIDPSSGSVVSTETHTFGHDGKGSTRVLLDTAAAIAQIFTYSAYGELLGLHNASGQNLTTQVSPLTSQLYNGEAFDARTGLYNMRARWYSPSNARWERLDPFAGNPNDPFSFHKYGFVHGDPLTGIDPSGLSFITQIPIAFGIAGGLIGGAVGATMAYYSGTSIILGLSRGILVGMFAGMGLAYGGIWLVGYAGWLGSVLLSIVATEGLFFSLIASMKSAELKQKGPPPTPERARHDYDYARLSLSIYEGARRMRDAVESDGWEGIDGIGGEDRFYSYRSRLYKNDSRRELVMVYEGSTPSLSHFGDWANNFQQGTTMVDAGWQYTRAKRDAVEAVEMAERLGYKITMTGHSLGGGLATASALHTRQKAVTFNAAGVNPNTTRTSGASRLITNYRVQGEILSTLQDSPFFGWFLPNSSAGTTYWLRGRSDSPIARHTDDILQGMEDFF